MIKCLICGKEAKTLTRHLIYFHKMSTIDSVLIKVKEFANA